MIDDFVPPPPLATLPPPPPPSNGATGVFTGPQPTRPGPFHACVRGPNGLDVNVSGQAAMVAAQLRALAEELAPTRPVTRTEPHMLTPRG